MAIGGPWNLYYPKSYTPLCKAKEEGEESDGRRCIFRTDVKYRRRAYKKYLSYFDN